MARALVLAIALGLMSASISDAETVWQRCLATKSCKAEVDKAIAARTAALQTQVDALKADLARVPCQGFAYSKDEISALVGKSGPTCAVIHDVQPCDGDYCATWVAR